MLRDEKRKQQTKQTRGKANSKNQQTVSVTVSIGVAEHLKGQTFDQCMKVADEALYRAKKKAEIRFANKKPSIGLAFYHLHSYNE